MKKCNVCKKKLNLSNFHKNKKSPDGVDYTCKKCSKIRTTEWIKNNRLKNRATVKKSKHKWRLLNPEKNRQQNLKYQIKFQKKITKRIEIIGTVRYYFESQ